MKNLKFLFVALCAVVMFACGGNKKQEAPAPEPAPVEVKKPDPITLALPADAWKKGTPYFYLAQKADKVQVNGTTIVFTAGDQVYNVTFPEGFTFREAPLIDGTTVYIKGKLKTNNQTVLYGDPANKDKSITPDTKAKKVSYKDAKGKAKQL